MITPCLSAEVAYVEGPWRPWRRHTTNESYMSHFGAGEAARGSNLGADH